MRLVFILAVLALSGCIGSSSDAPEKEPEPPTQVDPEPTSSAKRPDYGSLSSALVRPGDRINPQNTTGLFESWGGGCTVNFMFENETALFFGTAAHCFDGDAIGRRVEVHGKSATKAGWATVVYHSLNAMGTDREGYEEDCMTGDGVPDTTECRNDFALLELDADLAAVSHPSMRLTGGPIGLATGAAEGDAVIAIGRSKDRIYRPQQSDVTDTHTGIVTAVGDWKIEAQLAPIVMGGDSGGPGLSLGQAYGVLTIRHLAPITAGQTDPPPHTTALVQLWRVLEWMEDNGGPQVELVTADLIG